MILRMGLTGNMGCGKSTIGSYFRPLGTPVIDCDVLAKEMIFGSHEAISREVLGVAAKSKFDRGVVAGIIFADDAKRMQLEAVIAPYIWERVETEIALRAAQVSIVEAATLYELGWDTRFDDVIVAHCLPQVQRERLTNNRGMRLADIEARLRCQLPQEFKLSRALYAIDTNVDRRTLQSKVYELHLELQRRAREKIGRISAEAH